MHPIKSKRLQRLANSLRENYPLVAAEIENIICSAANPLHPKAKFRVGASVEAAIKIVTELLQVESYALAGGVALNQWVDTRCTYNMDFIVTDDTFSKLPQLFSTGETQPLSFKVNISGEAVQFLNPKFYTWTTEAIKYAPISNFLDYKVHIVSPEYLVLYKFVAARERDVEDIKALLTLSGVKDKARFLIGEYLPREEIEHYDQIESLSEWGL